MQTRKQNPTSELTQTQILDLLKMVSPSMRKAWEARRGLNLQNLSERRSKAQAKIRSYKKGFEYAKDFRNLLWYLIVFAITLLQNVSKGTFPGLIVMLVLTAALLVKFENELATKEEEKAACDSVLDEYRADVESLTPDSLSLHDHLGGEPDNFRLSEEFILKRYRALTFSLIKSQREFDAIITIPTERFKRLVVASLALTLEGVHTGYPSRARLFGVDLKSHQAFLEAEKELKKVPS